MSTRAKASSRKSSNELSGTVALTEDEETKIRENFSEAATVGLLDKASFVELVKRVAAEFGQPTPSDKDLDAAFVVADEGKSGNVDADAFVNLYSLVKSGEVSGLTVDVRTTKKVCCLTFTIFLSFARTLSSLWPFLKCSSVRFHPTPPRSLLPYASFLNIIKTRRRRSRGGRPCGARSRRSGRSGRRSSGRRRRRTGSASRPSRRRRPPRTRYRRQPPPLHFLSP